MHYNAMRHAKLFFETYCSDPTVDLSVVEIGSYNVNGSLKDVITPNVKKYTGVDFSPGPGVDVILTDPYHFPFADNTFDVLVTSSCFEHSELFWLTFLESLRILKPNGIMYCNTPSAWMCYHQFPVDCWRFYPDSARALETWACRNKLSTMVLESYISTPSAPGECADMVGVFLKDKSYQNLYPNRTIDRLTPHQDYVNAFRFPITQQFPNGWSYPSAAAPMGVQHPLS